jgi:hypothetical protein
MKDNDVGSEKLKMIYKNAQNKQGRGWRAEPEKSGKQTSDRSGSRQLFEKRVETRSSAKKPAKISWTAMDQGEGFSCNGI